MGSCMIKDVTKSDSSVTLVEDDRKSALELKNNYAITSTSKILGAGAFGKVFLSHNRADPSH
jgi:hypothetical protein